MRFLPILILILLLGLMLLCSPPVTHSTLILCYIVLAGAQSKYQHQSTWSEIDPLTHPWRFDPSLPRLGRTSGPSSPCQQLFYASGLGSCDLFSGSWLQGAPQGWKMIVLPSGGNKPWHDGVRNPSWSREQTLSQAQRRELTFNQSKAIHIAAVIGTPYNYCFGDFYFRIFLFF